MSKAKRVGVLISGRGSNMASLIEACSSSDYPAEIAHVISNVPDAPGLEIAARKGIPATAIDHKGYASREDFEKDLDATLRDAQIDLICNAGFMRLLTEGFVEAWRDRQLNIHPSLLPAFKGLRTHERAIEAGVRLSGCTVHFVRTEMDSGPIVAQAAVPVLPEDTPDELAARVLEAEHKLYPFALKLVASGEAKVVNERVMFTSCPEVHGPYISPWIE
ncbi:MAG: phosphoribosylglycinamide formyltransferase [Hyphomicrobiaceae bacterium]|nr:phosphoribosylglycinamide formyltransferase [Hyphomicrobiaceae bacterium]